MTGHVETWLIAGLLVVGSFFLTVGTIGLLRFDTVYNRMHATSKPSTLGTAAIFLAGFVHFGPGGAGLPSIVAVLFLFLTMPTGAHMIARSAERMGVPFTEGVTWPSTPSGEQLEPDAVADEAEGAPEGEDGEGGDG